MLPASDHAAEGGHCELCAEGFRCQRGRLCGCQVEIAAVKVNPAGGGLGVRVPFGPARSEKSCEPRVNVTLRPMVLQSLAAGPGASPPMTICRKVPAEVFFPQPLGDQGCAFRGGM